MQAGNGTDSPARSYSAYFWTFSNSARPGQQVYTEASITGVADGQITVTSASAGVDYTVPCSQVINAADMVANTGLLDEVSVAETYAIGDCANPFNIGATCCGNNVYSGRIAVRHAAANL